MRKWSTPTLSAYLEGVDLTAGNYYIEVYLSQGEIFLEKNSVDNDFEILSTDPGSKSAIMVPLTQEETGMFDARKSVKLQVSYISPEGDRHFTNIVELPVRAVLKEGKVEYREQ